MGVPSVHSPAIPAENGSTVDLCSPSVIFADRLPFFRRVFQLCTKRDPSNVFVRTCFLGTAIAEERKSSV